MIGTKLGCYEITAPLGEGEDLAERLKRGPLPPDEALGPQARESFLLSRARRAAISPDVPLADFKRAMALERAFAAAGRLLESVRGRYGQH